MALIIDTDRPTLVGLTHTSSGRYPQFRESTSGCGNYAVTLRDEDAALAFFPPGESVYETEVEEDPENGTLWFPLPPGRSIHSLRHCFDRPWQSLSDLISEWFSRHLTDAPIGVSLLSRGPTLELILREDGRREALGSLIMDIPDELLQRPIRNGSPAKEHGFDPWDDDQKERIILHLDTITNALFERVGLTYTVPAAPMVSPPADPAPGDSDQTLGDSALDLPSEHAVLDNGVHEHAPSK